MMKQWSYKTLFDTYLGVFAALMIIFPKATGAAVLPIAGFIVAGVIRKELKFRLSPIAIVFIALYTAYAVGVIYTNHQDIAFKYLEYKLSLVITPILLSFSYKEGHFSISKLSTGLILGVLITGVYGVIHASGCYMNEGEWACFLTGSISPTHHPSYFMAYMIVAVILAWIGYRRNWKGYKLLWVLPFTVFIVVFHVMSLSLAGVLFMLLTMGASVLYIIYKKWGKLGAGIALVLLPLAGYFFVISIPQVEGEWNGAKWYAQEYMEDPTAFVENREFPMSGSEERLVMWTVAVAEFGENPMGVGTGNVDERLGDRLRKLNQPELADKALNPHNQYLQTAVEIGIIGLVLLLMILGYGIVVAIRERNGLLLLIIGNLAFNCLFESMLQRQSGIVFFTFWICLLIMHKGIYKKPQLEV